MARLTSTMRCVVPTEKVRDYLLNPDHEGGGPKARFFLNAGFSIDDPGGLARSLEGHASENEIDLMQKTGHGTKYRVKCHIRTPNSRDPCVVSIWIDEGRGAARLITAYPR